jgi:hypothetical protein
MKSVKIGQQVRKSSPVFVSPGSFLKILTLISPYIVDFPNQIKSGM